MHIFLTGEIQVGKSTIIRRLLAATGLQADGFRTYWRDAEDGGADLYMKPFGEPYDSEAEVHVAHKIQKELVINEPAFDTGGVGILNDAGKKQLIIMDELGFMESRSLSFQQAVLRRIDGDTRILGVIKPRSIPFLDAVRAHPNVMTVLVTPENREEVFTELLEKYFS